MFGFLGFSSTKPKIDTTPEKNTIDPEVERQIKEICIKTYKELKESEKDTNQLEVNSDSNIEREPDRMKESASIKMEIKKFQLDAVKMPYMALVCGKKCSGKTTLIKDLLAGGKHFDKVHIFSYGEQYSECENRIPHEFWTDEIGEEILKEQNLNRGTRTCIVIEDDGGLFWNSSQPSLTRIIMSCRLMNISLIFCAQSHINVSPRQRSNSDYIFLFKESDTVYKKKIYDLFARSLPTYNIFNEVFSAITPNYGVFIIDNTIYSSESGDNIFHYRVSI